MHVIPSTQEERLVGALLEAAAAGVGRRALVAIFTEWARYVEARSAGERGHNDLLRALSMADALLHDPAAPAVRLDGAPETDTPALQAAALLRALLQCRGPDLGEAVVWATARGLLEASVATSAADQRAAVVRHLAQSSYPLLFWRRQFRRPSGARRVDSGKGFASAATADGELDLDGIEQEAHLIDRGGAHGVYALPDRMTRLRAALRRWRTEVRRAQVGQQAAQARATSLEQRCEALRAELERAREPAREGELEPHPTKR